MSWTVTTAIHSIHTISDSAGLLACYKAITSPLEDMVNVVECGNWGEAGLLEHEYAARMERLGHSLRPALLHEEVQRRRDLMMRILVNDVCMHALVCPYQGKLIRLVSRERRVIDAHQAYAAVSYY